jgi:hypothetical protein
MELDDLKRKTGLWTYPKEFPLEYRWKYTPESPIQVWIQTWAEHNMEGKGIALQCLTPVPVRYHDGKLMVQGGPDMPPCDFLNYPNKPPFAVALTGYPQDVKHWILLNLFCLNATDEAGTYYPKGLIVPTTYLLDKSQETVNTLISGPYFKLNPLDPFNVIGGGAHKIKPNYEVKVI